MSITSREKISLFPLYDFLREMSQKSFERFCYRLYSVLIFTDQPPDVTLFYLIGVNQFA